MKRTLAFSLFLLPAASILADDGALSYGGTPALLGSHPSISMASEKIVMTVGEKWVDVDCRFVFKNTGKACKVRMGFPDIGDGAEGSFYSEEFEEAKSKGKKMAPYHSFAFFKSWVDGKPAKIALVPEKEGLASSWHVKEVSFGANQTRVVHDVYRVAVGGGSAAGDAQLAETSYVMHTGASWKGPIGSVEVLVNFKRAKMTGALSLKPNPKPDGAFGYQNWPAEPKGLVMWDGFAKPAITGKTLRFTAKNLEPGKKDDIYIAFEYVPRKTSR